MLDQGRGLKLDQVGFGDSVLAETRASKLKGKTGTIINRGFDELFLQCRT